MDHVTRFNESIDESVTTAVRSFGDTSERIRVALLAAEQASRRQAELANRAKDVFLATLSHEMRTPLNAIVGWLAILRLGHSSSSQLHEGLQAIERNTKAQVQLIEDILDVSRIVSGKLRIDVQPCALIEVITAGVDAVRPAAEARGIAITLRLDEAANRAFCDPTRVQ